MNRAQRTPDPEPKAGLRGKEASSRNPGVNAKNDQAQMREKKSPTSSKEEKSEPANETRRPVTNHDEEKKIVNGGQSGAMDEKETEGI